ncbi:hypothetical protein KKC45_00725 [Patescibacteria group bacterium]|nr:hypothetical protein [Patescibacteria group bacterium]
MKNKLFIISITIAIFSLIISIATFYFLFKNDLPHVVKIPGEFTFSQGTTTIITKDSPESIPDTSTSTFSFGALSNIYEDTNFGFSLNYPEEMIKFQPSHKSCYTDLRIKDQITGFYMSLYSPACPSPLVNISAQSLDDYKKNYIQNNGVVVSILNTSDIETPLGTKGIKQEYQTFPSLEKIEEKDPRIFSTRYIFHNPEKGFYIIKSGYSFINNSSVDFDAIIPYRELENEIIKSVEWIR